jgi:hypothetical protein
MYISADISKILTLLRTVDDLNKNGTAKNHGYPIQNNVFYWCRGTELKCRPGDFQSIKAVLAIF